DLLSPSAPIPGSTSDGRGIPQQIRSRLENRRSPCRYMPATTSHGRGRSRPERRSRGYYSEGPGPGAGEEKRPSLGTPGPTSRMMSRWASATEAGGGPRSPDRSDSSASADPGSLPPAGRPGNHRPMERATVANRWNLDLIEDYYDRWRKDPTSVEESWRNFFEGYELGH